MQIYKHIFTRVAPDYVFYLESPNVRFISDLKGNGFINLLHQ